MIVTVARKDKSVVMQLVNLTKSLENKSMKKTAKCD